MLTSYTPSDIETITERHLVFDDGMGNGLCFPCDEDGYLLPSATDAARANYEFGMAHPEKYVRWNKIITETRRYKVDPVAVCECGTEFNLYNQYLGGCECPGCGRWYNLFGQELNPPETWSDGDDW